MTARRATGRNQRGRTELITILWRDIPAQVTARAGRRKKAVELPGRFQTAIDRAAMVAGKQTYDQYIGEWRRTAKACGVDVEAEATAEATRLDREYPLERLARMAANGGFERAPGPSREMEEGEERQ
ncbi:MAG: virulence factor [bacterium]|nr:virulence factor [bacterium]